MQGWTDLQCRYAPARQDGVESGIPLAVGPLFEVASE